MSREIENTETCPSGPSTDSTDAEDMSSGSDEQVEQNEPEGSDEGDAALGGSENVVIEKNDRSLSELTRWYKSSRLVIDPEWQRSYVWDRRRASRLVESFLMDVPVPVIYLAKTEDTKYEVIDGVQRLTSVFKFFDGEFPLSGLEIKTDLNKKRFKDLSPSDQGKIEDSTLRTFELSARTSKNLLFIIFERLNTGGVALNTMEIRNCIFRGRLNDLIKQLARYVPFRESVNQQNLERRMVDRSLVLRFLAFYEKGHNKVQAGLKAFLNDFFETYRDASEKKLKEFEAKFQSALRCARSVFGDQGFRLRKRERGVGGEWSANVNSSIFQVVATSFTNYDASQVTRCADSVFEEYLDLITTDANWVDCVTKSTGDQSRIKYAFETWNARLADVLKDARGLDPRRTFSRQLKEEFFRQNKTCAICNQEIKLLNDAALDHKQHYWRGGETIPENARLVHRSCNATRPR